MKCPKCQSELISQFESEVEFPHGEELIEHNECASCGCKFSIW